MAQEQLNFEMLSEATCYAKRKSNFEKECYDLFMEKEKDGTFFKDQNVLIITSLEKLTF